MLYGLEAANRPSELHPYLEVVHRLVEQQIGGAYRFRCLEDGGQVDGTSSGCVPLRPGSMQAR
jgi:hypothetical protein